MRASQVVVVAALWASSAVGLLLRPAAGPGVAALRRRAPPLVVAASEASSGSSDGPASKSSPAPEARPEWKNKATAAPWKAARSPIVAQQSIVVVKRSDEAVDSVIAKLRRAVNRSGHLRKLRAKRFHETSREKRIRKHKEGCRKRKFEKQRSSTRRKFGAAN